MIDDGDDDDNDNVGIGRSTVSSARGSKGTILLPADAPCCGHHPAPHSHDPKDVADIIIKASSLGSCRAPEAI